MGPDAKIFIFCMLSFKPVFSLSSFTFIKRLFSSSLLSAIRVVSSAYLRLLMFLWASLIPASDSSSLAFHMMYPAYKLKKQDDNIQPWRTPFLMWYQSLSHVRVTIDSFPAYRFLRRCNMVWYSHLFKNFPQFVVIHRVKGFSMVNEAEIDVFSWNSLAFSMIQQILAISSLVPLIFLIPVENL